MHNLANRVSKWTRNAQHGPFYMESGFYAGRAPSTRDVNSQILEAIRIGLRDEVSQEAAVNFVRMVNQLDDLSASSFVVALERFFASDCKEVLSAQRKEDRTRIDAHGDDRARKQSLGLVLQVASGPTISEEDIAARSEDIKADFIRWHEHDIPKEEKFSRAPSPRLRKW